MTPKWLATRSWRRDKPSEKREQRRRWRTVMKRIFYREIVNGEA